MKWIIFISIVRHLLLTFCAKFDRNLLTTYKVTAKTTCMAYFLWTWYTGCLYAFESHREDRVHKFVVLCVVLWGGLIMLYAN